MADCGNTFHQIPQIRAEYQDAPHVRQSHIRCNPFCYIEVQVVRKGHASPESASLWATDCTYRVEKLMTRLGFNGGSLSGSRTCNIKSKSGESRIQCQTARGTNRKLGSPFKSVPDGKRPPRDCSKTKVSRH